jgi:hypothetical protein
VIVSAHSLGGVLASASILAIRDPQMRARISLLTYGCQLRAFFSRLLPELLGPDVLGVAPCRSARLTSPDPWADEIIAEEEEYGTAPAVRDDSLLSGLTGPGSRRRWINLWRRTDYIGFPVASYLIAGDPPPADGIDEPAEEVDTTRYMLAVQTHSDYPRVPAYTKALGELAASSPDAAA